MSRLSSMSMKHGNSGSRVIVDSLKCLNTYSDVAKTVSNMLPLGLYKDLDVIWEARRSAVHGMGLSQ